ncbi:MAG: transcription-repair coupling factor [Eubacteriales bacterium]|jgi:transcription-repair coupling factor (superfamily II helicase)
MIEALQQPIREIADIDDIRKSCAEKGVTEISGCIESQTAHLAMGLRPAQGAALLVAENEKKARELFEDCRLFDPDVMYFPRRDLIFYQADVSGNLLTQQRMQVIKALIEQKNVTVVTSTGGCMDFLLPIRVYKNHIFTIHKGDTISLDEVSSKLAEMGYERLAQVESPGQFAIRGDILDIYSLTDELPWRIELWGDEVDLIRTFSPETQRSIDELEEVTIFPAAEEIGIDAEEPEKTDSRKKKAFRRQLTDTFPDYLPDGSIIFLVEPMRIFEAAKEISDEYQEAIRHRVEEGKAVPADADRMMNADMLAADLGRRACVLLCLMEQHRLPIEIRERFAVTARQVNSYNNQFQLLVRDLRRWKANGDCVVLLSQSRTRGKRLADDLTEEGVMTFFSEDESRELAPGEVMVTRGSIRHGFEYPLQKFVLITESDIFGTKKNKSRPRRSASDAEHVIHDFSELSVGDYVVHEDHGLGIYRGIEKVTVDNNTRDYIRIEYSGGSSLYIPATQLDMLQKYSGSEGHQPKINRLGGKEWTESKRRVRTAVKDIAKDLVALYAARSNAKGYAFSQDTEWQREFEEMFPYEETEGQLKAIEDTKRDMESGKVMDRLICGDVGYGKTEVAIRAAFKAVQDNKQVVLLCPTTILAQQHYNTFAQRMKDFPVRVDLLSRFRTPAQQKKTIEDVRKGFVDILIGTHRVLSKDIQFKDLGLLIVDEEQRFGVAHKEKIKQMKKNVDVLTLTATPIPRTLHMSLIGIRDISMLEEAPLDRMPVQTYVMEYDDEIVREAISRELARGGQVYFVYNRVKGIAEMTNRIRALVPDAVVEFAHGQMDEQELERIMVRFVNGEIDVLVSTTIIETGMDIPNVNTLIIADSDRLGLSQLYQLRGRVGRSNRNAYAFLMYRKDKILKEDAEKRLHAIREFTELGSGVRIAMRDLEIRGAGNLLGAEQSGHMEAVGYDLYCKMLREAILEEKGEASEEAFETSVDIQVNAYIPSSYIEEENQKLDIYKRISGIENEQEADDILDELLDRFGEPPHEVRSLVSVALLKADAHSVYVTEIKQTGDEFRITVRPDAKLNVTAIPDLLQDPAYGGRLSFHPAPADAPYFLYRRPEAPRRPVVRRARHSAAAARPVRTTARKTPLQEMQQLIADMRERLL